MKFPVLFLLCGSLCVAVTGRSAPPPHGQVAKMARYVVHSSDWVSIATISSKVSVGYPFANLKSMSDGPVDNGTGVPYLYMSNLDITGQDALADNRVTVMCSLAQSDYCTSNDMDQQDPRCARVMLIGRFKKVPSSSQEYNFAIDALFARHPHMKDWPKDHNFYIAKIDIEKVLVLDWFGGLKTVPLEEYFKPDSAFLKSSDTLYPRHNEPSLWKALRQTFIKDFQITVNMI